VKPFFRGCVFDSSEKEAKKNGGVARRVFLPCDHTSKKAKVNQEKNVIL
jgi:hypothetical protein